MDTDTNTGAPAEPENRRCSNCDSIVPEGSDHCLMCGQAYSPRQPVRVEEPTEVVAELAIAASAGEALTLPAYMDSTVRESRNSLFFWLVAVLVGAGLVAGWVALRDRGPEVMAAFAPTASQPAPSATLTPTWTPLPAETGAPTATPEPSLTPQPTSTPREPRFHSVRSGETLFGLSLSYRVSAESIAEANGFDLGSGIQSGQSLVIPWPTATPPLESILIEINGEPVLADVTDCRIVTIQSGDSAYGLSAVNNVPLEAIIAVNRQTMDSIQLLQPGDTLCIPRILYGDTIPPTPGPSPTPSPTPLPQGPSLLSPVAGAALTAADAPVALQWAAVKTLAPDEWYMVDMRDLDQRDALPRRGFTRDQVFYVPADWLPETVTSHTMQWHVSIVRETGRRSDGGLIYTLAGETSRPGQFIWSGTAD